MVDIARMKAAAKGPSGVRFEVMSSQRLTVTDHSVDAVVSRFGLPSFGDPMVEADQTGTGSVASRSGLFRPPPPRAAAAAPDQRRDARPQHAD